MAGPAIRAVDLGKRYAIGELQRYKALRDSLTQTLRAPMRIAASLTGKRKGAVGKDGKRFIWALREATFDIDHGEIVGLIGSNGAGKSTLLKILTRITEPTEGYAEVEGRVGSLLEVGTGFHWELTGRENMYLNGAILGMTKNEIDRRFDDIVAFAEIDRFIDTPVKLYSSGMYLRLAFAVAAHLEPEILLVDEVLAVGDAAFQKKCLGKMGDVADEGRTVVFVSHHMNQIRRLCNKCIWIEHGRIQMIGPTTEVVAAYESSVASVRLDEEATRDRGATKGTFASWH